MGLGAGFHLIENLKDKERKSKDKDKGQDPSSTKMKDKEKDQDVSSAKTKDKDQDVSVTKSKDKEKEEAVVLVKRRPLDDPALDTPAVSYGWTAMIEDWLCTPTHVGTTPSAPSSHGESPSPLLALNDRPISSGDLSRRLSKKEQRKGQGRK
jgi:hypothetical protein